ncbi:MAG: 50S ribosomal protein L18Ae [Euryarchaeota archaeon]
MSEEGPEVRVFEVRGTFRMGDEPRQPFRKQVTATREEEALEKVYSELGSEHRVSRTEIRIEEIKEIDPEDVEDPVLRRLLGVEE